MLFASLLALAATAAAAPSIAPKEVQPFNPPKAEGFTRNTAVQQWIGDVDLAGNTTLGYLKLTDTTSKADLGWVNWIQNSNGEYKPTKNLDRRLVVRIDLTAAAAGSFDLFTVNGPDVKYPYFGGVKGYVSTDSNLGPQLVNYLYLAGVSQTAVGAIPIYPGNTVTAETGYKLPAESAIWKLNNETDVVTPAWVNTDSTVPTAFVGICADTLIITGNKDKFVALGYCDDDDGVSWVDITFVQG